MPPKSKSKTKEKDDNDGTKIKKPATARKPRKPRAPKEIAGVLHYEPRSHVNNHKLKNAMVTTGHTLRTGFLAQKRRYLLLFYLDPGYINGGANLTIVDLQHPECNFSFLWKIDLFEGEKPPPDVLELMIVDRMRKYIMTFQRMFGECDILCVEKQLERTVDQYASTCSKQMGDVLQDYFKNPTLYLFDADLLCGLHWALTEKRYDQCAILLERINNMHPWLNGYKRYHTAPGKEVNVFDVGIVHRMYPWLYPELESTPPAESMNRFAAANREKSIQYRHNKRCSAALVSENNLDPTRPKFYVTLDAERWLVGKNMRYHQRLRNDFTDKYDDYGDAFAPGIAFLSIVCADEHMMERRKEDAVIYKKTYVFIIPECMFLEGEKQGIIRYLNYTIIVFQHDDFPFMRALRKAHNETLCLVEGTATEYPSWEEVKKKCCSAQEHEINPDVLAFLEE